MQTECCKKKNTDLQWYKIIWNNMRRRVYPIAILLFVIFISLSLILILFSISDEHLKRDKSITAIYSVLSNILVATFFTFFIARQNQNVSKKKDVIINVLTKFESVFFSSFCRLGAIQSVTEQDLWAIIKRLKILLGILAEAAPEVCSCHICESMDRIQECLANVEIAFDASQEDIHQISELYMYHYLTDYEKMQNLIDQVKAKIVFEC